MDFPIYRKYKGIEVWFKIDSITQFTEIKKMGSQWLKTTITASIYPEKQFINDMINCYENRWEEVSEKDFSSIGKSY
ncbi:MAG: hypothetical protein AB8B74_07020 [Crocinitomicaceae bacterium]